MDVMWRSQCEHKETIRAGAARFVKVFFAAERAIIFGKNHGEFRFSDGAWWYKIECDGSFWTVRRLEKLTPRALGRHKAVEALRKKGLRP